MTSKTAYFRSKVTTVKAKENNYIFTPACELMYI